MKLYVLMPVYNERDEVRRLVAMKEADDAGTLAPRVIETSQASGSDLDELAQEVGAGSAGAEAIVAML